MATVIQECERRGLEYFLLHTGQHYSYEMDRIFIKQLELPPLELNLNIGSGEYGEQEEAYILGVPRVTLGDNTERPEPLDLWANMLAGSHAERILKTAYLCAQKRYAGANLLEMGRGRRL